MRWKITQKENQNEPTIGNWRIKKRFAWKPVRTPMPDSETMIWLEFYKTNDMYSRTWDNKKEWVIKQIAPLEYWPSDQ
jgi:hypothetical protein